VLEKRMNQIASEQSRSAGDECAHDRSKSASVFRRQSVARGATSR
jgi:hypothetical protein